MQIDSRTSRLLQFIACGFAAISCLAVLPFEVVAQEPELAPVYNLTAIDKNWDNGQQVKLTWTRSADDIQNDQDENIGRVEQYRIERSMTVDEIKSARKDEMKKAIDSAKGEVVEEILGEDWNGKPSDLSDDVLLEIREARAEAAKVAEAEFIENWPEELDERWQFLTFVDAGTESLVIEELKVGAEYEFRITAIGGNDATSPTVTTADTVVPVTQFFDGDKFWFLLIAATFCGAVIFWILYARTGREIKVRKISGLEAVDEAVGRATEMGRPILFVPGIQDVNEMQTIAGITMLSRVAKTAAEYDAKVEVPTARSLVMATAQETVQAAYLTAGRPDAFNPDLIYYVTNEQFGYVAYVSGLQVREKPAACFYMGMFYAESLILAETGNSIGAIQVAGTAQPSQLPFFVAACDYTLIGEEFFAASAYLSGSPSELGSLKGQDVGKIIVAVILVIGVTLATVGTLTGSETMLAAVDYLKDVILD